MILADSSVWIDHFRSPNPRIEALVRARELRMHPFVAGELSLGSLARRQEVLDDLSKLTSIACASNEEVAALIEARRLFGRGIGLVDTHLLASALAEDACRLWTRDKRLHTIALELGVADQP